MLFPSPLMVSLNDMIKPWVMEPQEASLKIKMLLLLLKVTSGNALLNLRVSSAPGGSAEKTRLVSCWKEARPRTHLKSGDRHQKIHINEEREGGREKTRGEKKMHKKRSWFSGFVWLFMHAEWWVISSSCEVNFCICQETRKSWNHSYSERVEQHFRADSD